MTHLRWAGPSSAKDIACATGIAAKSVTNSLCNLKALNKVESYGVHQWRAIGGVARLGDVQIGVPAVDALSPQGDGGEAERRDPEPEIPAVPMARKAADELSPIADDDAIALRVVAESLAAKAFWPKPARDELGLLARAEAVASDIEDLIGDACDRQLGHDLIKALTIANGAMHRAAHRLAQG
jgi:hypothetical protein